MEVEGGWEWRESMEGDLRIGKMKAETTVPTRIVGLDERARVAPLVARDEVDRIARISRVPMLDRRRLLEVDKTGARAEVFLPSAPYSGGATCLGEELLNGNALKLGISDVPLRCLSANSALYRSRGFAHQAQRLLRSHALSAKARRRASIRMWRYSALLSSSSSTSTPCTFSTASTMPSATSAVSPCPLGGHWR